MGQHQDIAHDQALIVGLAAERAGVIVKNQNDPNMSELMAKCNAAGVEAQDLFATMRQAVS